MDKIRVGNIVKTYGGEYGIVIQETATFSFDKYAGKMYGVQPLDNFNETYWMYAEEIMKCGFFESIIMKFKYGFLRGTKKALNIKARSDWDED